MGLFQLTEMGAAASLDLSADTRDALAKLPDAAQQELLNYLGERLDHLVENESKNLITIETSRTEIGFRMM